MNVFRSIASGFAAALTVAALVQPAAATQFTWNQNGGFFFPGAGAVDGSGAGTGTLRAGPFHGTDLPPLAAHGGLEFSGVQGGNAPPSTYSLIQWGCVPDGNNSAGVSNCVNAGVLANTTVAGENFPLAAGRSALRLQVFDSNASGVLDSATQTPVVIARIDHLNRVIDNEANALARIRIDANLIIDAVPQVTDANSVPIGFLETRNISGGCAPPNPLGSTCDDVFTFDTSQFANVPFTHNGEDFFIQFGIAPIPECNDPTPTQIGTITIFDCTDVPGHRSAIDFTNGLAWAQEGFDNGFLITMFITEEPINVPAPAGIALLGLGLIGLGLARRRNRKVAA